MPAGRAHHDLFAGFRLTIPRGWVSYYSYGLTSYAPDPDRLIAYDGYHGCLERTFTFAVEARQDITLEEVDPDVGAFACDGPHVSWRERHTMIAGHRARVFRATEADSRCPARCRTTIRYIQFGDSVIRVMSTAGSRSAWLEHRPSLAETLATLRPGRVHPVADTVRAFMQARIDGSNAERWITEEAAEHFERVGLYRFREGLDDFGYNINQYSVETVRVIDASLVAVDLEVHGPESRSVPSSYCSQREQLLFGQEGEGEHLHWVVLGATVIQSCGTS